MDAAKPRKTIEDKDRKLSETPDLVVGSGRSATKYKTDLIPPALVVARFFAEKQVRLIRAFHSAQPRARAQVPSS
jgi:type I restriction enzyme M protein